MQKEDGVTADVTASDLYDVAESTGLKQKYI